ncbi:MAG TPA: GNAT family N-acetyltransferase [Anaerolineae bacterium]|nr:GNAT family N-acetyltransferase [Anaerolineae bacterium]
MVSIVTLAHQHVDDGAKLFVQSYAKQRESMACLPPKYAKHETAAQLLEGILENHPGVATLSDGRLVGYLTGYGMIPNFKSIQPGAYVPEWAHAAADGHDRERIYQFMLENLSRAWIGNGSFAHAITFFAADDALRELFCWAGFGLLVVDAVRVIDPADRLKPAEPEPEIVIRQANEGDLEELARLDNELINYLQRAPTFLFPDHEKEPDTAVEFLGENAFSMVAEKDQRLLACIRGTLRKEDACTIVQDASVMGIDFAYTDPNVRGMGIGRRLLDEILDWGRSRQKTACAVDFESANALGSAFWMKHFSPVCFSAIRHVDPRVAESGDG